MQAAHRGAKDGSIQSAVLFSHFADEFGLRGGILFIQHLTKGVDIDSWRDPKADWLKGDPHRMPFELATDPTVTVPIPRAYSRILQPFLCRIPDTRCIL